MEIHLLNDIVIIFLLSLFVVFLFNKIGIPPIMGFLATGIISGPYGLSLINSVHEVELLAEIGVLLLLFTIGIEFSFKQILELKKPVLLGGTGQLILTSLLFTVISYLFVGKINNAIFLGFLFGFSSTAIVLKLFTERNILSTPHGKTSLSILIYQDIAIIPLILAAPILGGKSVDIMSTVFELLLGLIGIFVLVYLSTKYFVPFLFKQILLIRSKEIFLIAIFSICLSIVWITSSAGLSLALGAFLAGLIISESEYSHEALSNILPFRDVFTSFFFVSIGMLLDFRYIFEFPLTIATYSLMIIIAKSIIAAVVVYLLRMPLRTAIITGLSLSQVGEFSFILARYGISNELINEYLYKLFLAVSILTMALTPLIISFSEKISDFLLSFNFIRKLDIKPEVSENVKISLSDHLIIVGFGENGKNLVKAANFASIPFVLIDMNPDNFKQNISPLGSSVFGDASNEEVLKAAKIEKARIIVVAINDPFIIRNIISEIKRLNPKIYLIVRTRYIKDVDELKNVGADEVIPEEFETSVEIFARVLHRYLVPFNEIESFTEEIRNNNYQMLRSSKFVKSESELHLSDLELTNFLVKGNCELKNKTLKDIDFRNKLNSTVIAVKKGKITVSNPNGDTILNEGDTVFLLTTHDNLSELEQYFSSK